MANLQKEKSDFRYNTGDAKVPWDAVAVKPDPALVGEVVRFLVQEGDDPAAYRAALKKVDKAIGELFRAGKPATKLSLGKNVKALEDLTKEILGVRYASFLVNWTAGYDIALDMAGVGPGDEVIIPAITFIATAAPVLRKGARVVFADVDPTTVNMDPADVARKITPRTRAIVPVHIGGYPVDMDPIMELARARNITVIEDAAHGFGGTYKGRRLGTIGDFGAFSFHEVKNITALGEGGILVTNDDLGAQFSMARFCGFDLETPPPPTWLYNISPVRSRRGTFVAGNYSTTEIQAVALLQHMRRNDEIIAARRQAARYLHERLAAVPGIIPGPLDSLDYGGTFHLFLLRVDPEVVNGGIQALKAKLSAQGITQIAHFCPLYHYKLFTDLGYQFQAIRQSCPNAEKVFFEEYTHLPLYDLPQGSLDYMADAVLAAARELSA